MKDPAMKCGLWTEHESGHGWEKTPPISSVLCGLAPGITLVSCGDGPTHHYLRAVFDTYEEGLAYLGGPFYELEMWKCVDHYPGAYASRIVDVASLPEDIERHGSQAAYVIWLAHQYCACECAHDCDDSGRECDCDDSYICLSCDARDALGMMD